MKKLFYLIMALPLLFVACDDDDDFPSVKINVETSGCKIVNGVMYVVQGDTLSLDSISVVPMHKDESVVVVAVNYYWDRMYVETNNLSPFQFAVDTEGMMPGRHLLQLRMSLVSVNYAPVIALIRYPIMVVLSEQDIPDGNIQTTLLLSPEIDD